MRYDDPDKSIEELKTWISDTLYLLKREYNELSGIKSDQTAELKKINRAIVELKKLGLPIHEEVVKKKEYLEDQIIPIKIKTTLIRILFDLQELINDTKAELNHFRGGSTVKPGKRSPQTLRVTLPDGEVICEEYAVWTMIKTLQFFGLDKVAELTEVQMFGHPLVSGSRNRNAGELKEVDGFFIETHSNTHTKAKRLERISRLLGIDNVKIELINGEI